MLRATPEEATAVWTAVAAIAAVVTGLVAIASLLAIMADSRDRSRPYVTATVVPGMHGPGFWDLVVKNYGASAAYGLTLRTDRWPSPDAVGLVEALRDFFDTPRQLAPGEMIRAVWRADALTDGETWADGTTSEWGMPERCAVHVQYRRRRGSRRWMIDRFDVASSGIGYTPVPEGGADKTDPTPRDFYDVQRMLVRNVRWLSRDY